MARKKRLVKVFTAEFFWRENAPFERMKHIKGLHPLAYGASYSELTSEEKSKVRAFIRSLEE